LRFFVLVQLDNRGPEKVPGKFFNVEMDKEGGKRQVQVKAEINRTVIDVRRKIKDSKSNYRH
jgi:hypothetical protein